MRLRKICPIETNREYPCPCRRKGKLLPIVLTEALGCELCQNIFVLSPQGKSIEQLNISYPYKKVWYWTGRKWITQDKPWRENLLLTAIVFLFALLIFCIPLLVLKVGTSLISAIMVGLIIILLFVCLWFAYRR